MAAAGGTARLADRGPPAAETILPVLQNPLGSCDATASGAEDAQVGLTRGLAELSLCGHHFTLYESKLHAAGWQVIYDHRSELA